MIIHDVLQQTQAWFDLRGPMPTSSDFDKLITGGGNPSAQSADYAFQLCAAKRGNKEQQFQGNRHTERGNRLEPDARMDYELITGHEVTEVGFITDDLMRAGTSTDGLVGDDGLIEIKCLMPREFEKVVYHYKKTGVNPPGYKPQVQGELLVTQRKWCDMVFYSEYAPTLIVRVFPDAPYQNLLSTFITAVILKRDEIYNTNEAGQ